jgi:hypothetical protein
MNVFSSPSDAFEDVAGETSTTALWLVPLIVSCVLAVATAMVMFGDPIIKSQLYEMQVKAIQEQVEKGTITQEMADRQQEAIQEMESLFVVFAAVGALFMIAVYYFGGALVLWLAGKIGLKGTHGYSTYLAVYGVASWIAVLGALVTGLLVMAAGSIFATPSAALLIINEYDPSNTMHRVLSRLNLFSLWQTVVVGIGLSTATHKPVGAGVGIAFGLYLVWSAMIVLFRIGV